METMTLKALRANRDLSLEKASTLIGISTDTLSNYERGKTFPDIPIIKSIERAYNIRILTDTVNFLVKSTD